MFIRVSLFEQPGVDVYDSFLQDIFPQIFFFLKSILCFPKQCILIEKEKTFRAGFSPRLYFVNVLKET